MIYGIRSLAVFAITFSVFLFQSSSPAYSDETQKLVTSIKQIASSWRKLAENQTILLSRCANNTFRALRLSKETVVNYDVRRTQSIVNPYIGIITLNTIQQDNADSPKANGFLMDYTSQPARVVCFKSIAEAKADTNFTSSFGRNEYVAIYHYKNGQFVLSSGNEVFQNAFLKQLLFSHKNGIPAAQGLMWK